MLSACRVTISSNIRVINQTNNGKEPKMTSNDFTKTSTYADLYHYWASEDYELNGIDHELNYCQPIDRDQAVDDEGHAMYDEYVFYKADEEYNDPAKTFSAEQIEQFAQTW